MLYVIFLHAIKKGKNLVYFLLSPVKREYSIKYSIKFVTFGHSPVTLMSMGKYDKLLIQILRGTSDANISFDDLCHLLKKMGFEERIRGSHHIFTKKDVEEILNLQPKGGKSKPYQIKQIRNVIIKYKLGDVKNE